MSPFRKIFNKVMLILGIAAIVSLVQPAPVAKAQEDPHCKLMILKSIVGNDEAPGEVHFFATYSDVARVWMDFGDGSPKEFLPTSASSAQLKHLYPLNREEDRTFYPQLWYEPSGEASAWYCGGEGLPVVIEKFTGESMFMPSLLR